MQDFFVQLSRYFRILRINDAVDILIVAVILYYMIKIVRETRAMQLLKGLAL